MPLFDSHAHYFDRRFLTDAEGPAVDELLPAILAPTGEVSHIINVGTSIDSSRLALAQSARYDGMYAAVGIHPEDCQMMEGDPEDHLSALCEMLGCHEVDPSAYRRAHKIVALGEIGLDYYERDYLPVDKARQAWYFEQQMTVAAEQRLPVIIHDREAHGDCFEMALRYPTVQGVFHSFSGSAEMAHELTRRGWYVSFSGVVTFKNARRVVEVAASVPLDRLLVETDAPYLTPHPHRGERNDSSLMRYTVEALAALHGISPEQMARVTAENASRLFEIPLD